MEKEFATRKQALALKELGCDEPCYRFYYGDKLGLALNLEQGDTNTKLQKLHPNYVAVPLKQQVFRWFREKYDAHIHPRRIMPNVYIAEYGLWASKSFDTYEEAENACIDKLIELAKQKDND